MTKEQKMELRKNLREKFTMKIASTLSSDVEGEGLKIMSDYLGKFELPHISSAVAFMRLAESWGFANFRQSPDTLMVFYEDFGLTEDVMSIEHFIFQYPAMYASEAARTIIEWRERNEAGCETAY